MHQKRLGTTALDDEVKIK